MSVRDYALLPYRWLRARLVDLRDAVDRARHPGRHRRAREALTQARPTSVLFVCLGNVCRSPYAEAALRMRTSGVEVESAGFIGPGRPPPDTALEAARTRSLDHGSHRSREITPEMLARAGAVFVFDRFNVARLSSLPVSVGVPVFWLGDLDPVWAGKRAIIDPWGKDSEEFDRTFERIDRCVDVLIDTLEVDVSDSRTNRGTRGETDAGR